MACGWFFSVLLASMPLFGVSDYRKFAICLPFEIGDPISLGKPVTQFLNSLQRYVFLWTETLLL